MSKTIPAGLLTKYALGSTHFAHGLFIEREDGELYGMTTHDVDDEVDGFTYAADPGFTVREFVIASGLDVGHTELTLLHDGSVFSTADILGEKWRNASFLLFRYWYLDDPIVDIDECLAGTLGEIELGRNTIKVELHDLRRYMNQAVGAARSKTCRYRLGSTSMLNGGLCMKDISGAPFTLPFTVTHVSGTARLVFRDSSLTRPADWFGEGSVEFLTGDLAGIKKKVRAYDADGDPTGTFHLALPTLLPISVGDTGIAVVGCRKRRSEDCKVKFSNAVNHGGEADARNVDTLTRPATADA